jgi:hypothetical protein
MMYYYVFLYFLFISTNLLSFENDSTETSSKSPKFGSSIKALFGGGNKNYHEDSFYSMAIRVESKSDYTSIMFEIENLINNETGYESCFGEPAYYKKSYNTTYYCTQLGFEYKYVGIEFGGAIVSQTRGWCENILEGGYAFFYRLNLGILSQYYLSVGNSDNFRVSLNYKISQMGFTYLFDNGISKIRLETMNSEGHRGFGLIVNKLFNERFVALGELYYYNEIKITKSERTFEVFNMRVGIGYLFVDL